MKRTRYARLKEFYNWLKWQLSQENNTFEDIEGLSDDIRSSLTGSDDREQTVFYDEDTRIVKMTQIELTHTQSSDRKAAIETLRVGSSLKLANLNENPVAKTYYWIDQTRVDAKEYEATGSWHSDWCEVLELFVGNELPINLNDSEVVSIFNTGKMVAIANLSDN